MDKETLGHVRAAKLSPVDVKILTTFMTTGGEFPFYVDRLNPATRDQSIAAMNALIARDFIEVIPHLSSGHRWMLRLTDEGRRLCDELEKMTAKPVQVEMNGDTPEVVAPEVAPTT